MGLSTHFPRSPYDMNAGLVMLPRTTDKCRASIAGSLGEYHYNCPLDMLLFEFLGIDAESFSAAVKANADDAGISKWIDSRCSRSQGERDAFNNSMRHRVPQDEEAATRFAGWQKELGRSDYFTYFDNLDADEGRF